MLLSQRIKIGLTLWLVGEALTFLLIVHVIGIGGAFLLGLMTSLIGVSLLKRAGRSAVQTMRSRLNRPTGIPSGALLDDTLATIGALALLLPGFLSDIVGLILAVPPARARIAAIIAGGGARFRRAPRARPVPRHGPSEIDLDPNEWRQADPTTRSMPKG